MFNCWRPSKLQGDQNGICITRLEANIPTDPKMPRPIATGMLVHAGQINNELNSYSPEHELNFFLALD
ncbi:hypothetical protein VNO77_26021 [Canavalia gladiata]|uniref:Uncharacterized protein n=1 Tax=Canavalia gladiata TaxID=3824 RepID=A0AAN9KRZ9_CANGL